MGGGGRFLIKVTVYERHFVKLQSNVVNPFGHSGDFHDDAEWPFLLLTEKYHTHVGTHTEESGRIRQKLTVHRREVS